MATFTKNLLSESTLGEPIQISATSSSGELLHTAVDGYANFDELWIYASNTSASNVTLTIELGSTGLSYEVDVIVEANNTALVVPGVPMQGGGTVRAYASATNVINVFGWVNNILTV